MQRGMEQNAHRVVLICVEDAQKLRRGIIKIMTICGHHSGQIEKWNGVQPFKGR